MALCYLISNIASLQFPHVKTDDTLGNTNVQIQSTNVTADNNDE